MLKLHIKVIGNKIYHLSSLNQRIQFALDKGPKIQCLKSFSNTHGKITKTLKRPVKSKIPITRCRSRTKPQALSGRFIQERALSHPARNLNNHMTLCNHLPTRKRRPKYIQQLWTCPSNCFFTNIQNVYRTHSSLRVQALYWKRCYSWCTLILTSGSRGRCGVLQHFVLYFGFLYHFLWLKITESMKTNGYLEYRSADVC